MSSQSPARADIEEADQAIQAAIVAAADIPRNELPDHVADRVDNAAVELLTAKGYCEEQLFEVDSDKIAPELRGER